MAMINKIIPKKKKPPAALPPTKIGKIAMIDQENHFVLIDAETTGGALAGTPLICIANDRETGNLRLSNLKSNPFLVADIIGGNPAKGDTVYTYGNTH